MIQKESFFTIPSDLNANSGYPNPASNLISDQNMGLASNP